MADPLSRLPCHSSSQPSPLLSPSPLPLSASFAPLLLVPAHPDPAYHTRRTQVNYRHLAGICRRTPWTRPQSLPSSPTSLPLTASSPPSSSQCSALFLEPWTGRQLMRSVPSSGSHTTRQFRQPVQPSRWNSAIVSSPSDLSHFSSAFSCAAYGVYVFRSFQNSLHSRQPSRSRNRRASGSEEGVLIPKQAGPACALTLTPMCSPVRGAASPSPSTKIPPAFG